jgi:hypothetical protein
MSHTPRLYGPEDSQEAYRSRPLDEAVWRAWLKKNLLEERSRAVVRTKAVNWVCILALLAAVVMPSHVSTLYVFAYEAAVRIIIGVGAILMMFNSIRTREYGSIALFGALVLLFNPLVPAFRLWGNGPILLASILPFVATLLWMRDPSQPRRSPLHIGISQGPISETIPGPHEISNATQGEGVREKLIRQDFS